MWMASAGARPYYDRPHDLRGLRPIAVDGTPTVFLN